MPEQDNMLAIKEMVKNVTTAAPEQFTDAVKAEADFLEYDRLRSLKDQDVTAEQERTRTELRKNVIIMMTLDKVTAEKLDYREEMQEVYLQNELLEKDAERSGVDKVAKDFLGRKKSAAKKKIASNNRLKDAIEKKHKQREADALLEEGERSYEVNETQGEVMEQGKNSGAFMQRFCNKQLIGPQDKRLKEYPVPEYENTLSEKVDIATNDGILKGVLHRPTIKPTGKVVVYYSGNTASTMSQSKESSQAHLDSGASVLCVDYRGFGKSISVDKKGEKADTNMLEDGMYRDSMAIYNYAKLHLAKSASDIILHGYSLGGSMASRVAAQVALDNADNLRRDKVSEKDRLGGLILQSPINSAHEAALLTISTPEKFRNNETGWFANLQAKILMNASGKFSTEEHMKTVAKYDPNIPVLFLSGSSKVHDVANNKEKAGDFLSIEDTKIDELSGVKNTATFIGNHKHLPGHMKFSDKRDETKSSDAKLEALLKFGRATDLRMDNQTEPVPIKGLESNGDYKLPRSASLAYIRKHNEKHNNPLTKTLPNTKYLDFCMDNKEVVVGEALNGLNVPAETTPEQLKSLLMESKPYATCVCTMTHIGKQVMMDNPPQLNDDELLGNLTKPMAEGVVQNGSSNLQNVIESLGKLEEKSFSYFMQSEKIKEMYDQMQAMLEKVPFFATQPKMMGQALGLLFADLSLEYMQKFNTGKKEDKTAFGMLLRNKSMIRSLQHSEYSVAMLKNYVPAEAFVTVTNSVTSNTSRIITQDIINKQKEK